MSRGKDDADALVRILFEGIRDRSDCHARRSVSVEYFVPIRCPSPSRSLSASINSVTSSGTSCSSMLASSESEPRIHCYFAGARRCTLSTAPRRSISDAVRLRSSPRHRHAYQEQPSLSDALAILPLCRCVSLPLVTASSSSVRLTQIGRQRRDQRCSVAPRRDEEPCTWRHTASAHVGRPCPGFHGRGRRLPEPPRRAALTRSSTNNAPCWSSPIASSIRIRSRRDSSAALFPPRALIVAKRKSRAVSDGLVSK